MDAVGQGVDPTHLKEISQHHLGNICRKPETLAMIDGEERCVVEKALKILEIACRLPTYEPIHGSSTNMSLLISD